METIALFSTPLFISDEYALAPGEEKFLRGQAWRSNAGGNKSSLDSHVLDRPEVKGLRTFLQAQVDFFVYQVLKVKLQHQFYITQSWMNFNEKGTQHHPHAHQNSLISGVYYLDGDDSPIVFRRPASHTLFGNLQITFGELNLVNAGECNFAAQRNRTMLFPSTTQHYVTENHSEVPRMSLAYNTFVRGQLGDVQELTELHI